MVIELGPPVSESSTRISKLYDPTDSEHKCHKTKIQYFLSIDFELDPPDWEPTVITTTPCSAYSIMGRLKVLYTHLQILGTILPVDTSLLLNCASALKIYTQCPEKHQMPTKTNHHLLNHLQILHTN